MCVSPVSMFGGGGIDPLLAERYAVLNEQLRQKRLAKLRGVEPTKAYHPRVESVEEPPASLEDLRKMYANPILQQIPILTGLWRGGGISPGFMNNTPHTNPMRLSAGAVWSFST